MMMLCEESKFFFFCFFTCFRRLNYVVGANAGCTLTRYDVDVRNTHFGKICYCRALL